MKIAVIGYGVVGKHMVADIERAGHTAVVHDVRTIAHHNASHEEVNACEAAFVCVSTPPAPDGSCDTSAIDDVFAWLRVPVAIIRSTVPPGTTWRLRSVYVEHPEIVFCPEFIGEGVNAPYNAMRQPPFVIIGGTSKTSLHMASEVFAKLYNSECEHIYLDSTTAELAKYAENYFLALKVSWANELYNVAQVVGADFPAMMAAVTHDYRIGRSHTHVYADKRGYDGRCLPKDTSALLALVGAETAPLLAAMIAVNEARKEQA
jgi:UDPglucose 6-dehydrogenase